MAILEAASEDDEDDESPTLRVPQQPFKTPKQIALEVVNEVIDLVLESVAEDNLTGNEIMTNQLLQKNAHKLHKQVFFKVKVMDSHPAKPLNPSSSDATKPKKTFKNQFGQPKEPFSRSSFQSHVANR